MTCPTTLCQVARLDGGAQDVSCYDGAQITIFPDFAQDVSCYDADATLRVEVARDDVTIRDAIPSLLRSVWDDISCYDQTSYIAPAVAELASQDISCYDEAHNITTAYLPEMIGAAVIGQTLRLNAHGILPEMTGHAVVRQWQPIVAAGTLPAMTGHAELTATQRMSVRGTLPAMTGHAQLSQRQLLVAHGTLPAMTGQARVRQTQTMRAAGTLPEMTGQATLVQRISMTAHGTLPAMTGAAELRLSTLLEVHGTLPEIYGGSRVAVFQETDPVFVMNAETTGISVYSLRWSDIVEHDGQVYGLSAAGLERPEGPIEASASPHIETGKMNLAPTGHTCNVSRARALVASNGPLLLTATPDLQGRERVIPARLAGRPGDQERNRTVNPPLGPEADAWQIKIGSPEGAAEEWSLSALEVVVGRVMPKR